MFGTSCVASVGDDRSAGTLCKNIRYVTKADQYLTLKNRPPNPGLHRPFKPRGADFGNQGFQGQKALIEATLRHPRSSHDFRDAESRGTSAAAWRLLCR